MKYIFLLFIFCFVARAMGQDVPVLQDKSVIARDSNLQANNTAEPVVPEKSEGEPQKLKNKDQVLPRFCIDLNFKYGTFIPSQTSVISPANAYPSSVNVNVTTPKFTNGKTIGGDFLLGYFLGKEHMFGFGTGAIFTSQQSDLTMGTFHVEYRDTDAFHNVYRQIISAINPVSEHITSTNVSIPILFKFKHQFPKSNLGVSADLGPVINVNINNHYSTNNVAFNYEAAYDVTADGNSVYDGSTNFKNSTWIITQDSVKSKNPGVNVSQYFSTLNTEGYPVKLNQAISKTGTTFYSKIGYGFIAQAGVSYQINYRFTINLYVFDLYQSNTNSGNNNFEVTSFSNKVKEGVYSSMMNGITSITTNSIGGNLGIRCFIGKDKDIDGDGTADKDDDCPYVFGPKIYNGCPDSDGDGIPDQEDDCPLDAGPACTNGCPDRDGDCVADKDDLCPDVPGVPELFGCPDSSGLYRSDTNSEVYKYRVQYDYTEFSHHVMLSKTVINFESGESSIPESARETLNEAIDTLKKIDNVERNEKVFVYISGHTDNKGGDEANQELSVKRAESVRRYMIQRGVKKNRIIISGSGKKEPVIDNDTPAHRAKNRRIEIRLLRQL